MDIRISKTTTPKPRPPETELGFGRFFSDHLFAMDFTAEKGWHDPRIQPYGPFQVDPAAGVFHYGQAMFEGSKVMDTSCWNFAPSVTWRSARSTGSHRWSSFSIACISGASAFA